MVFVDQVKIYLQSGKGGDGCVSFRREKYVANGGPNGGDGGRGGDVIFVVNDHMNTLYDFRHKKHYKATNGEPGGGSNCSGKDGEDMIIEVPRGTIIKDAKSEKVIMDMTENDRYKILTGGYGGKGNQHFATPTMQIPKFAQPGKKSRKLEVILELKSIADVGLVGFPNVGKSTLLSRVSNARPKIANYHFTTLNPNLGVVELDHDNTYVIADIPGLIEGAAEGIGLGHEFLKHVERTKVLVHVVDAASVEGRDPVDDIHKINQEMKHYNPDLLSKPQVIAANKLDAMYDESILKSVVDTFEAEGIKVFPISAVTGQGLKPLLYHISDLLKECDDEVVTYASEIDVDGLYEDEGIIDVFEAEEGFFVVEGTKVDKMMGYTNLESEKGFVFFQNFLKDQGIIERLEALGIEEGDTVSVGDIQFEYFK